MDRWIDRVGSMSRERKGGLTDWWSVPTLPIESFHGAEFTPILARAPFHDQLVGDPNLGRVWDTSGLTNTLISPRAFATPGTMNSPLSMANAPVKPPTRLSPFMCKELIAVSDAC